MPATSQGLPCPACGSVANSRVIKSVRLPALVRRYRERLACGKRFVTQERVRPRAGPD